MEVLETIKDSFTNLTDDYALQLLVVLFLIFSVSSGIGLYFGEIAETQQTEIGPEATLIFGALLGLAILNIVLSIATLRAFGSKELTREHFTNNIGYTFLRFIAATLTIGIIFIAVLMSIMMLGGFPILMLAGALAGGASAGATMGGLGIGLAILFFFVVIGAILAATLAAIIFSLSLPEITNKQKGLMRALQDSVERTQGYRIKMFLVLLPLIIIQSITAVLTVGLEFIGNIPLYAVFVGGFNAVELLILYSMLAEMDNRIPDAETDDEE